MRRFRPPQDVRSRRRQFITYALGFGAFVLFVNALVGDNGYLAAMRARRDLAEVARAVDQTKQENEAAAEQIRRMKEEAGALEEAARRDLNLIKDGETLIIIKDAKPAAPAPAPKPAGK